MELDLDSLQSYPQPNASSSDATNQIKPGSSSYSHYRWLFPQEDSRVEKPPSKDKNGFKLGSIFYEGDSKGVDEDLDIDEILIEKHAPKASKNSIFDTPIEPVFPNSSQLLGIPNEFSSGETKTKEKSTSKNSIFDEVSEPVYPASTDDNSHLSSLDNYNAFPPSSPPPISYNRSPSTEHLAAPIDHPSITKSVSDTDSALLIDTDLSPQSDKSSTFNDTPKSNMTMRSTSSRNSIFDLSEFSSTPDHSANTEKSFDSCLSSASSSSTDSRDRDHRDYSPDRVRRLRSKSPHRHRSPTVAISDPYRAKQAQHKHDLAEYQHRLPPLPTPIPVASVPSDSSSDSNQGTKPKSISPTVPSPLASKKQRSSSPFRTVRSVSLTSVDSSGYPPHETASFNLFYLPTRKNYIGSGRYCTVYLGNYNYHGVPFSKTCAVKRLNDNPEAQYLGLEEAYILHLLNGHSNIIRIIEIVDENDMDDEVVHAKSKNPKLSLDNLTFPPPKELLESSRLPGIHDKINKDGLSHPKIPRYCLVLEFAPGGTIWDYIQKNPRGVGKRLWMRWARQLAGAVEQMHSRDVVHHDIKPHNVLLSEFDVAKLSDFSNACIIPPTGELNDGLGKGTLPYSPPELLNIATYTSAVDIYSLGVTLYVAGILGTEPFQDFSNPVHIMLTIKRGFFYHGINYPNPNFHSQVVDNTCDVEARSVTFGSAPTSPVSARRAVLSSSRRLEGVSSLNSSMNGSQNKVRGVQIPGTHKYIRFLNGDLVDPGIWNLIVSCVNLDPNERPTASELLRQLKILDGVEDVFVD